VYQKAFDATIEAIARVKTRLFQIVATNLTKQTKATVPFTKEACERRHKVLMTLDPLQQGQQLADPFSGHDEFDNAVRNMRLLKEAEDMEKEAQEAERIAKAEQEKIQAALEAKRKAEEEVAKAKAILKAAGEQAKQKTSSAAKKRAAAQGLRLRIPVNTPLDVFSPTPSVQESTEPVSPSPSGRKDRPKNLGVDQNDHRHRLTVTELEALCRERGLSKKGSKADIMNRLRDHDNSLSNSEMGQALTMNNMNPVGSRIELLERMAFLDATKSAWGRRISQVTDDDLSPHTPAQLTFPSKPSPAPFQGVKRSIESLEPKEEGADKRPRAEQDM
jgi:SAP domain